MCLPLGNNHVFSPQERRLKQPWSAAPSNLVILVWWLSCTLRHRRGQGQQMKDEGLSRSLCMCVCVETVVTVSRCVGGRMGGPSSSWGGRLIAVVWRQCLQHPGLLHFADSSVTSSNTHCIHFTVSWQPSYHINIFSCDFHSTEYSRKHRAECLQMQKNIWINYRGLSMRCEWMWFLMPSRIIMTSVWFVSFNCTSVFIFAYGPLSGGGNLWRGEWRTICLLRSLFKSPKIHHCLLLLLVLASKTNLEIRVG